MKNKLSLSLIVIALAILPNLSFAQTTASSTKPNATKKETIKTLIDAKKEEIKNSVAEIKQNAATKIKDRVNQFVQNVIDRYGAANARLEKLAERLNSRIAKIEAKKIDVTKAKALMVVARAKLETAKTSVALINLPESTASTTDAIASTTVASLKADFQSVKTQLEKAKSDIKEVRAALVDVVNSLKPGDEKLQKSAATSTASTTNSGN